MNTPLLTIAIPTYNRPHYLQHCLEAICPQIDDNVEIVVRDNCSDNYDFFKFIEPYVSNYKVKAIKNDCNVGADANIARCFELCKTQWLWVLGDDDCVLPSSIAKVLEVIKKENKTAFIKFNSLFTGRTVGINEFCSSMKHPYAFSNAYFISEGVHNIGLTKKAMFWQYKYLSTNIGQILRIIKYIIENRDAECLFLSDPLLESHGENVSWTHFELVYSFLYILDVFRPYKRLFRDNIFKCIVRLSFIYIRESNLSFRDKLYYTFQVIYKYGLINSIRYSGKIILKMFV